MGAAPVITSQAEVTCSAPLIHSISGVPPVAMMTTSGFSASTSSSSASVLRFTSTPRRPSSELRQSTMPMTSRRQLAREANTSCPPSLSAASSNVTLWPRSAQTRAASNPAGPPPTTTTLRPARGERSISCGSVISRPVDGLCRQLGRYCDWQCVAPTQGLISASRSDMIFLTICGSAICARVIATISSMPSAMA